MVGLAVTTTVAVTVPETAVVTVAVRAGAEVGVTTRVGVVCAAIEKVIMERVTWPGELKLSRLLRLNREGKLAVCE
jgi:hypothetical protein